MAGLINASTNNFSKGEKGAKTTPKTPRLSKPKFERKASGISGASVVCLNGTLQLSDANPGGTWSSSDVNLATVSATGLVTGLKEGTVTITYTYGGNSDTKLITVSGGVSLPEITFTGSTTLCTGSTLQLSNSVSDGNYTFWGSSDPSIASVSANGLVTAKQPGYNPVTINYYYEDKYGCGNYEVTVDVTVQNCNGYVQCARPEQELEKEITQTTIFPHGFYSIPTGLNVRSGATLMVVDAEIIMGDGVKINVEEGATLVLEGCHVYSCTKMWKGIAVEPGGKVMITGTSNHSSLIEDAELAVDMQMKFIPDVAPRNLLDEEGNEGKPMPQDEECVDCEPQIPIFYKFLSVDNTIFNRNTVSINIGQYRALVDPDKEYPFQVKNTIFTCREIKFVSGSLVWPDVYNFKNTAIVNQTTYPETPYCYSSPYIHEGHFPSTTTAAFLKSGVPNEKSILAIRLLQVGNTYHDNEEKPSCITIGYSQKEREITNRRETDFTDNRVIFDNMTSYGIFAEDTYLKVVNNTYQKGYLDKSVNPNGTIATTGIFVNRTDPSDISPYSLTVIRESNEVPTNAFFNLNQDIQSQSYIYNTIEKAEFRSRKEEGIIDGNGERGIYIETNEWKKINITNNYFLNIDYPIWTNLVNSNPNTPDYDGSIDINNNGIASTGIAIPPNIGIADGTGHESVNTAITLLCNFYIGKDAYLHRVNCNSNFIFGAYNGIKVSNFINKPTSVNDNTLIISHNDDANVKEQFGILIEGGGEQVRVIKNIVEPNEVKRNFVNPDFVTYNYIPTKLSCIKFDLQNTTDVTCNNVGHGLNGVIFNGYNKDIKFWDNIMYGSVKYGFTLDQGGIIGPQGGTCSSDNVWFGNWTNSYKTACFNNSDANNSKLNIEDIKIGTDYDPDGSSIITGLNSTPYSYNQGTIVYMTPTGTCDHNCSSTFQQPNGTNNNTQARTKQANSNLHKGNLKYEEAIALGTIKIATPDSAQRLYVMQQRLYASLLQDTTKLYNSNILFGFAASNLYSNIGLFYAIDTLFAKNDTMGVYGLLSSITSNNTVDAHYLAYYQWLLKLKNGEAIDTNAVYDLANGCPYNDGTVVFAARNLYNSLKSSTITFVNSCNPYASRQSQQIVQSKTTNKISETQFKEVSIYPNPTKGSININLPSSSNWQIVIKDITGRAIWEKVCNSCEGQLKYTFNSGKGIYFATIINKTTGKLVIQKIIVE